MNHEGGLRSGSQGKKKSKRKHLGPVESGHSTVTHYKSVTFHLQVYMSEDQQDKACSKLKEEQVAR